MHLREPSNFLEIPRVAYAIISGMQPENSQHGAPRPEQLVQPSANPEAVPSLPPVERRVERGQERVEQVAEASARLSDAAATAAVPVAQSVTPQAPPADPVQTTGPLVAADEDVIEKEWVDKAKQIIEQTRDDPHMRSQRVNDLQRDYLQKRYGKVVGASE